MYMAKGKKVRKHKDFIYTFLAKNIGPLYYVYYTNKAIKLIEFETYLYIFLLYMHSFTGKNEKKMWVLSMCSIVSLLLQSHLHGAKSLCYFCEGWPGFRIRAPALFHQPFPFRITTFWNNRPECVTDNPSFLYHQ